MKPHMDREVIGVTHGGRPFLALDSFAVPQWMAQQNSWARDPDNSDSSAYNYPLLLHMDGALNREALQSSLDELVQRHATLRSVFEIRGSKLVQVVLAEHACPLQVVDVGGVDESERESRVREIVDREAERAFQFREETAFRAVLLCMGEQEHALLIVTHHLVYDDWSGAVLVRELSAIYSALAEGQHSTVPEPSVQYGDFVRWAEKKLGKEDVDEHIAFWKERLGDRAIFHHVHPDWPAGAPSSPQAGARRNVAATTGHPAALSRPSEPALKRGATEEAVLGKELIHSLTLWSRRQHVSLFMALMTGFQCLLHVYSGDQEIGVGTCVANRAQMEFEDLIGRFGNHLVIRTDLGGDPSFLEAAARVRESSLAAYGYQEVPFGGVLAQVRGPAEARCDRVVQAMLVLQNAPKEAWKVPGLEVNWIAVQRPVTKFDLTLWLSNTDGIDIALEYNADLFHARTIQNLLSDYRGILETMLANPYTHLAEYRTISGRVAPATSAISLATPQKTHAAGLQPAGKLEPAVRHNGHANSEVRAAGAPSRDVEHEIANIWSKLLDGRAGAAHEKLRTPHAPELFTGNFFELGGDSLTAVQMLARIETRFRVRIPLATLLDQPTITGLAGIVRDHGSNVSWRSLVPIRSGGSRRPLFLFHGAGGNVVMYRDLARHVAADQPLYGLQSQGLDGASPLLTSIEEMARAYVAEIRRVQPAGPYFFGGYCMGGTLAFEAAQQLRANGEKTALLMTMDTPNWAALPQKSFRAQLYFELEKLALCSYRILQRDVRANLKCFNGARPARNASSRIAESEAQGTFPAAFVSGTDFDFLRHIWDINERAALAYRPRPYAGRIVQFRPARQYARYRRAEKSWAKLVEGGLDVRELPVGPGEMLDEPFVRQLAAEMQGLMAHTASSQPERAYPAGWDAAESGAR